MRRPLDDRDRQILDLLRDDAWLTYAAISERISLSASAIQRRVERLIRDGVLLGARSQVAAPVEKSVTLYFLAELADDSAQSLQRFSEEMARIPQLVEAYYVTGEADIVMKLKCKDMEEYDRLIAAHVNAQPHIRRFKTLVALRSVA